MSQSVPRKKLKTTVSSLTPQIEYHESILSGDPKFYPINWKKHDKRAKLVNLLNVDLDNLPMQKKTDEITQSCYIHWLASSDTAMELNPTLVENRLQIGPYDTPLASHTCIYGTQIDGGSVLKGLYRVTENIIVSRSCLQGSKACGKCNFEDLRGTTYLVRFFNRVEGTWQIDPLGVYYQLRQCGGIKRHRLTVTDIGTQTDLSGEKLDQLLNMSGPKGSV